MAQDSQDPMKNSYTPFQSKLSLVRFCLLLAVAIQFLLTLVLSFPISPVRATTISGLSDENSEGLPFIGWLFVGYQADFKEKLQNTQKISLRDESTFQKISKIHHILDLTRPDLPSGEQEELAELIYRESEKNGYDPELILALIMTESSFHKWAYSHKGAIGLMQLLPRTGLDLADRNEIPLFQEVALYDPRLNIQLGTQYLAELHQRFGDLTLAIAAYNEGPTRLAGKIYRGEKIPVRYSTKVLNGYSRFLGMETEQAGPTPVSYIPSAPFPPG